MKRALAGALAIVGLAVPAAVLADHRPGHQGGGGGSQGALTIDATSPIVWGRSTVISGTLRGSNESGQVLDLEADPHPYSDSEFATLATTATDARGDYRFVAKPESNTRYRVVAKTLSPPVTSSVATVLVRIRVKLAVSDSTPRARRVVRFSGTACPEHDGKLAYIQRRTSKGTFNTVSQTLLRDVEGETCSSYSKGVRVRRDGVYRVVARSDDGDHARGISRRVRIDVH